MDSLDRKAGKGTAQNTNPHTLASSFLKPLCHGNTEHTELLVVDKRKHTLPHIACKSCSVGMDCHWATSRVSKVQRQGTPARPTGRPARTARRACAFIVRILMNLTATLEGLADAGHYLRCHLLPARFGFTLIGFAVLAFASSSEKVATTQRPTVADITFDRIFLSWSSHSTASEV